MCDGRGIRFSAALAMEKQSLYVSGWKINWRNDGESRAESAIRCGLHVKIDESGALLLKAIGGSD